MGRGRAKAKQTKVARELKYSSQGTDFEALQRELAGGSSNGQAQARPTDVAAESNAPDEYDEYGDWAAGDKG
ncbi:MAG TPA: DUF3073 domain-containing protein [Actinomycetes bacterium]|jgi:hypothetical protein|nr:DUF3073 domain-containing protein [Actinomycetes bacterium]